MRLMKRGTMHVLVACYLLIVMSLTVPTSLALLSDQKLIRTSGTFTSSEGTVVSTELIDYYSMTSNDVSSIIGIFKAQGIPEITLRFNAYNEWSSGQPSSSGVATAKSLITSANAQSISVNIDSHTWYTTWDSSFRDSASGASSNRATYINYVKALINAFNGYPVKAFMVLNEPQARTASSSENQFILSIISAAKSVTSIPVSVRFMGGYSPSTGHYSSAIDDATDFLCRNSYWDPRSPSTSVYGCSESTMNGMISAAANRGKELWITEFGKTNSDQENQRAAVEAFVSYSKAKGIDRIYCWVSKPLGTGETYNIFSGTRPFTALPAFYKLVND